MSADDAWHEKVLAERDALLGAKYGAPAAVVPLPSETMKAAKLARGHVLLFEPDPKKGRKHWLYATNALAQPEKDDGLGDARTHDDPRRSGHGLELAIASAQPDDWAPLLLLQLLTYAAQDPSILKPGVRIPFAFTRPKDGKEDELTPALGQIAPGHVPAGEIIALLVWPALELEGPFVASTGRFDLLVATGITRDEWELAKGTSSLHVLQLLRVAGLGQKTEPLRKSVTADKRGQEIWERVKVLSRDQILDALYGPV